MNSYERLKLWRKNNPKAYKNQYKNYYKKHKKQQRLRVYNMTQEEYSEFLNKQRNCCGVCRKKFVETPRIDHSHKTNHNRGLLCNNCNLGLGYFKDNIRILKNAINYLKESV